METLKDNGVSALELPAQGSELLGNQTKKGRDKELTIPFNHEVEILAFPSTGYLKTKFSRDLNSFL